MELSHIIAFNIALAAALLSPGPAMLVAVQTTLQSGRRAGIAVGLGLGAMAIIWTAMALLGLEVIFQLFPWAYAFVKTIGALYLAYIAYKMWTGARDPLPQKQGAESQALLRGFMINLLNPKSMLFAAAVLIVALPQSMTAWDNLFILTNHLVMEWAFYTCLAFAMSAETAKQKYLSAKVYFDRTASVVLGALSVRLLAAR
ncbi:MAG: LysE family translocator [Pseudomonadota bacterium]